MAIQLCNLPGSILPTTSAIAFAKLDTCFTIPPTIEPKFFQLPPLIALATFFNAPQTLFKAPEKALIAPVCLKPPQNSLTFEVTDEIADEILDTILSILIPSRNFPRLLANLEKSTLSSCLPIASIALIPNWFTFSNAGCNLLDKPSRIPSMAWSTVLNSVAIFWKLLSLPAFFTASKKSLVLTLPAWISATSSSRFLPIDLATLAIPAGACSSIILKSCHATVGLPTACVIC